MEHQRTATTCLYHIPYCTWKRLTPTMMMPLNLHHQQWNWSIDILRPRRQTSMARACRQLQQHYTKSALLQVCFVFLDPTSPIQASLCPYYEDGTTPRSCGTSRPLPRGPQSAQLRRQCMVADEAGVRAAWTCSCRPPKSWPRRHTSLSSIGVATPHKDRHSDLQPALPFGCEVRFTRKLGSFWERGVPTHFDLS